MLKKSTLGSVLSEITGNVRDIVSLHIFQSSRTLFLGNMFYTIYFLKKLY